LSNSAPKMVQMNRGNDSKCVTKCQTNLSASPLTVSSTPMHLNQNNESKMLEPPTVIYHESAHSIVFRDNLRRAHEKAAIKQTCELDRSLTKSSHLLSPITRGRPKYRGDSEKDVTGNNQSNRSRESSCSSTSVSASRASYNSKQSTAKLASCDTSNQSYESDTGYSTATDSDTTHQFFMEGLSLTPNASGKKKKKRKKKKKKKAGSKITDEKIDIPTPNIIVANFTPVIDPLPLLNLGPHDEFSDLLHSTPFELGESQQGKCPEKAKQNPDVWDTMTDTEKDVVTKLQQEKCVVKTVNTSSWTSFLQKFPIKDGEIGGGRWRLNAGENASLGTDRRKHIIFSQEQQQTLQPFHSFATSTTLLPPCGFKMRCYGSIKQYPTGVIFALPTTFPNDNSDEAQAADRTNTWSWPSGYSAKTEYNIDPRGNLTNGRADALVSLGELRRNNYSYLHDTSYEIMGKMVEGGLRTVPFNEIYLRVGGTNGDHDSDRNFDDGVGLPIALFVRSATYSDLTALLRLRARLVSVLGRDHVRGIPLLFITPETGVRVLTEKLQKKLLLVMSNSLNPFQNPHLKHKTNISNTSEMHLQQKLEELLDLDDDGIRDVLTPEECARVAGGYGATDDSVANLLMDAVLDDFGRDCESADSSSIDDQSKLRKGKLQDLVNEGLTAAVRAGDYNTSRQLLILYTLVASKGQQDKIEYEVYL